MLSFSPKSDVGATDEAELIKVYFPKFTVTSNNNKINKVLFFLVCFISYPVKAGVITNSTQKKQLFAVPGVGGLQ